jgi:microsomal dipeptidase-like Zn-dependent dipeptidase
MDYLVSDLHCDLLLYLEGDSERTAFDICSRCAIPQLFEGRVKTQTLAIFAEENSKALARGIRQFQIYKELPSIYPNHFMHAHNSSPKSDCIELHYAFEGASTFCSAEEPLDKGLNRLQRCFDYSRPLYISFTWNDENRFGGGAMTPIGLKEDGKKLLEFLNGKGVAVDLSHSSDAMGWDILTFIDKYNFNIPIIASHSNSRKVRNVPRNLPEELIKEIIHRKGIIGFNAYKLFVGDSLEDMAKHVEHFLQLGGEDHIVFGCDFFYDYDLPVTYRKEGALFFPDAGNASHYPRIINLLKEKLNLSALQLEKIANGNFKAWVDKTQRRKSS